MAIAREVNSNPSVTNICLHKSYTHKGYSFSLYLNQVLIMANRQGGILTGTPKVSVIAIKNLPITIKKSFGINDGLCLIIIRSGVLSKVDK